MMWIRFVVVAAFILSAQSSAFAQLLGSTWSPTANTAESHNSAARTDPVLAHNSKQVYDTSSNPTGTEGPLPLMLAVANMSSLPRGLFGNPYATRGAGAVAPKLLSAIPPRITNAANHIFGSNLAKHKLGGVLGAFNGDATAATYALENAAQALANQGAISGVFKGTVVEVAGFAVTVRGRVIDGAAHLSTAFIP